MKNTVYSVVEVDEAKVRWVYIYRNIIPANRGLGTVNDRNHNLKAYGW